MMEPSSQVTKKRNGQKPSKLLAGKREREREILKKGKLNKHEKENEEDEKALQQGTMKGALR